MRRACAEALVPLFQDAALRQDLIDNYGLSFMGLMLYLSGTPRLESVGASFLAHFPFACMLSPPSSLLGGVVCVFFSLPPLNSVLRNDNYFPPFLLCFIGGSGLAEATEGDGPGSDTDA